MARLWNSFFLSLDVSLPHFIKFTAQILAKSFNQHFNNVRAAPVGELHRIDGGMAATKLVHLSTALAV